LLPHRRCHEARLGRAYSRAHGEWHLLVQNSEPSFLDTRDLGLTSSRIQVRWWCMHAFLAFDASELHNLDLDTIIQDRSYDCFRTMVWNASFDKQGWCSTNRERC
jgi:hypothetical protein